MFNHRGTGFRGGVIHVLPVTDVVPLDVSGGRPDGKQQPNPADALFSSIVLNFFGAYPLNLRINQIEDDKFSSQRKNRKSKAHHVLHSKSPAMETEGGNKKSPQKEKEKMYPIGASLASFLADREVISFIKASEDLAVKKKKGAYYIPSNLYAVCEF